MGCVCTSEFTRNTEVEYEWSFITLRFSDNEDSVSITSDIIPASSKENCRVSMRSTFPESQKSSEPQSQSKPSKQLKHNREYHQTGELMKYHPGISAQFISRYCVLTDNEFKYYKSIQSFMLNEKPLVIIPIESIEDVRQTNFHVAEKEMKFVKSNNMYQFEIFIKDEDEMTKLSRNADHVPVDKEFMMRSSAVALEDSVQEGKIMKRPLRPESPTRNIEQKFCFLERTTWSLREVEWYTAEKRLLFSAKSSEDACRWVSQFHKLLAKRDELCI